MPEGDTVYLAATRMRAALAGRELTRSDFRVPRYATLDLSGRSVDDVVSHGKHLLIRSRPRCRGRPAGPLAGDVSRST